MNSEYRSLSVFQLENTFEKENYSVEIFARDKSIFTIEKINNEQNINFDHDNDECISIGSRSGIFELEIEYFSNTSDGSITDRKTNTLDNNHIAWLRNILNKTPSISYLSLDTNFIQNCIYSNFIKDKFSPTQFHDPVVTILIPRLLILEIEHKYNRTKEGTPKVKQKEKRIAFNNMGEILRLIEDGARTTPKLNYSRIREFSSIAGGKFTDSFIRMETSDYVTPISANPPIFFFFYLMNAMAATAEGMDCLYFHVIDKIRKNLNISLLIYQCAIEFDECQISFNDTNTSKEFSVLAMWSGKTPFEWKRNIIKISEQFESSKTEQL